MMRWFSFTKSYTYKRAILFLNFLFLAFENGSDNIAMKFDMKRTTDISISLKNACIQV